MPTDCLLPWLTDNQRAVQRRVSDGIHLRVLDVPTALEGRRWDQPGELVFRLRDSRRPDQAGTYRLTVAEDGTATCCGDDAEPSIDLDAQALGALYLGSRTGDDLAAAGLLAGDRAAIDRARRLFAWPVAAWCDEMF
jgi:predicted acetyltransferase